jgi:hypothetical protein
LVEGVDFSQARMIEVTEGVKVIYKRIGHLCGPRCALSMRSISFLERHQTKVIEKLLRHCGPWEDSPPRRPPTALPTEG